MRLQLTAAAAFTGDPLALRAGPTTATWAAAPAKPALPAGAQPCTATRKQHACHPLRRRERGVYHCSQACDQEHWTLDRVADQCERRYVRRRQGKLLREQDNGKRGCCARSEWRQCGRRRLHN